MWPDNKRKIFLRDKDTRIIHQWSKELTRTVYILERRMPVLRGLVKQWKIVSLWSPDLNNAPHDRMIEDELNKIATANMEESIMNFNIASNTFKSFY